MDIRSLGRRLGCALAAALGTALFAAPVLAQSSLPLDRIKLPAGFAIELVARVPLSDSSAPRRR